MVGLYDKESHMHCILYIKWYVTEVDLVKNDIENEEVLKHSDYWGYIFCSIFRGYVLVG